MPLLAMYSMPVLDMLEFPPQMESTFMVNLQLQYCVEFSYACMQPRGGRKRNVVMKGSNVASLQGAFKEFLDHLRITCPSVTVIIYNNIF